MGQTIKRICQFCKRQFGTKEGFGQSGVSHGICPECESAAKCERCRMPLFYCLQFKICDTEIKAEAEGRQSQHGENYQSDGI
jgi:hypothetical protein